MKFEDHLRQRFARSGELRFTVRLSFDGYTSVIESVPEETARDWLWERLRGGTTQASEVIIREVTPIIEDGFGRPIEHAMRLQGILP